MSKWRLINNQLSAEVKNARRGDLERLLESQIARLHKHDCPLVVTSILQGQSSAAVEKILDIWNKKYPDSRQTLSALALKGIHLALPIIPREYLAHKLQMNMIAWLETGSNFLIPSLITNMFKTPSEPYYILDVEDGKATLNETLQDAEELIKKQGRRGLTEVEVISLGVHTKVLSLHFVAAIGSRYVGAVGPRPAEATKVPYLWVRLEKATLSWGYFDQPKGRWWGTASCVC